MTKAVRKGFLVVAACFAVVIVAALGIPHLLRWRMAASELSAAGDLRSLDAAIRAYVSDHGTAPPGLSSLRGHLPSALSCDNPVCEYRSYRFHYTVWSPEPARVRYSLSAQTLLRGGSSFYLDETGVLRITGENRAATSADPPCPVPVCGPNRDRDPIPTRPGLPAIK